MPKESTKKAKKAENTTVTVSKVKPKTLSLLPPGAIGYEADTFYPLNDNNPRVYNERRSVFEIMKRIQKKNPNFFYNELQKDNSILIDEVRDHILNSIEEPERKANRSMARNNILTRHTQNLQEHNKSKQESRLPGFIHNYFNPEPNTPPLPRDTPRQLGVPESPRFSTGKNKFSTGGKTRRKVHKKNRRKTQHNNK